MITASSLQLTYTENTVLTLLEGVTLSDPDQNCQFDSTIIGARIEIATEATDNDWEFLEVSSTPVSQVNLVTLAVSP